MSRAWKPLPTHLPGWNRYSIPDYTRAQKPPKRKNRTANKKRGFWRKPKPVQRTVTKVPFPSNHTSTLTKILRVWGPKGGVDCLWKRERGHWRCISATEPLAWFTRVNCPDTIADWLHRQKLQYRWLSLSMQGSAPNPPAGLTCPSGHPETGKPTSPLSQSAARPCDEQSTCGPALAQNGLANPRCLIRPGCPEHVHTDPR